MGKEDNFGKKINSAGFDKKPENINKNGAPKKSISLVNEELQNKGYVIASKSEISECYLLLINVDMIELKRMVEDDTQPSLIRVVGKGILSGKGFDVIEKALDRSLGKALQSTDITTKGASINTGPIQINFIKTKEDEE